MFKSGCELENMDYITTFAPGASSCAVAFYMRQTVCSDLPGKDAPFGHLELLVRDWVNYEASRGRLSGTSRGQDGFSLAQCKAQKSCLAPPAGQEQMHEHLDDHLSPSKVPEDARPRAPRWPGPRDSEKNLGRTFEEHL